MPKTVETSLGKVQIAEEVVAKIAGMAALECPGLAGMAPRRQVMDRLNEVLRRENLERGVDVQIGPNGDDVKVGLYIIVQYGVNIYDTAVNVQERVADALNRYIGMDNTQIHVYVQGVDFGDANR
ncbi:Asp23/Gls24 family envelope stress response protein [Alicyclobacillus acidocaldarius]|uniref:Asp23/Gls24 family envelope stress response protein n=1 Tax=Alicyclobacillus acidocaldarius (strain Tc-4-1) TaxID=1048834 RepID=F8IKU4_ALIAT|nr:Asp23/Gls24 family envelope stress response protein [Alicyclobacillus acidocaldarius]AEJ44860.1 protein of unknown function DUF322 [Alicyclobacillus acidocaldarius subsp. acidocaldarius Tc-4-1]